MQPSHFLTVFMHKKVAVLLASQSAVLTRRKACVYVVFSSLTAVHFSVWNLPAVLAKSDNSLIVDWGTTNPKPWVHSLSSRQSFDTCVANRWFGWLCVDGTRLDVVQSRLDLLWHSRCQGFGAWQRLLFSRSQELRPCITASQQHT